MNAPIEKTREELESMSFSELRSFADLVGIGYSGIDKDQLLLKIEREGA